MPIIETEICDWCHNIIEEQQYLIYEIKYWDTVKHKAKSWEMLSEALMFCSARCMGLYLANLIDGDKEELGTAGGFTHE